MKKNLKGDKSREVYFERLDKIVKRKNKKVDHLKNAKSQNEWGWKDRHWWKDYRISVWEMLIPKNGTPEAAILRYFKGFF